MRVVIDTNVLLSAVLNRRGLEARSVDLARRGAITICASHEMVAEYRDVLMRDKFAAFRNHSEQMLEAVGALALFVQPTLQAKGAIDEDDDRFLECAEAANAAYLITGNLRHFPEKWKTTLVVNARTFLRLEFPLDLE